jgi:aspartyl-tRNA(Asn)/glutamyl-tRNA(Gln) amidotransferase subunit B
MLLKDSKVSATDSKKLILEILNEISVDEKLKELMNIEQISNEDILILLDEISLENKELILEADTRPERVFKFLMGQLMKQTQGKINSKEASELIKKKFNL